LLTPCKEENDEDDSNIAATAMMFVFVFPSLLTSGKQWKTSVLFESRSGEVVPLGTAVLDLEKGERKRWSQFLALRSPRAVSRQTIESQHDGILPWQLRAASDGS
jgi:hypothetical protein